jgi:transcriptional regulator with XRE-family HTH domain
LQYSKDLGLRLREIRNSNNLGSIGAFSPKLGVDKNTLGGYERGERLPDVDFLAEFASITGADFEELLRLRLEATGHGDALREHPGDYQAKRAVPPTKPPDSGRGSIDREVLQIVIAELEASLDQRGLSLTPEKKAEAIVLLYEIAEEDAEKSEGGRPNRAKLAKIIRLVA